MSKRPRLQRKSRHSVNVLSDSSSDSEGKCPSKASSNGEMEIQRKSRRIETKRHKPVFQMPSRDAVWNTIPSVKSPEKLSKLSRKRTVNDFTKVYNTYNFDDYEDSGDEDDPQTDSDTSSDKNVKIPKRVLNYRRRLIVPSSSDENSEHSTEHCGSREERTDTFINTDNTHQNVKGNQKHKGEHDSNDSSSVKSEKVDTGKQTDGKDAQTISKENYCETVEYSTSMSQVVTDNKDKLKNITTDNHACASTEIDRSTPTTPRESHIECANTSNSPVSSHQVEDVNDSEDSEGIISPSKRRCSVLRRSVLESDSSGDEDESYNGKTLNKNHRMGDGSLVKERIEVKTEKNDNQDVSECKVSSIIGDNDNEGGDESDGDEDESDNDYDSDDRFQRASKLKETKLNKFTELKGAICRRKARLKMTNLSTDNV